MNRNRLDLPQILSISDMLMLKCFTAHGNVDAKYVKHQHTFYIKHFTKNLKVIL